MIKKAKVRQAVEIVRQLNLEFHKDSSKKKNLLEDDNGGSLFLQISLKKIPDIKNIKMIKMALPNSIPLEGACLITGDLDKKNHKADIDPDILHYKEILSNCGVTGISEVVTLRQLRTDYKSFEARQLLSAGFDTFIADKKIAGVLPRVLGKHFFKKRKFPIQIDLKSEDLKKNIDYALSKKVLFLSGHGNSCALEVAHLDMDDSKIVENIMAAVNILSEKMPGSWDNIMGLYLRMDRSKSIPIYMSYDGASEVKFDAEKKIDITVDELSTLPNATVRVYSDGRVECTRKRKNDETEDLEEDVSSSEEEEEEEQRSRRKRKKSDKNSLPECDQLNDDVVPENEPSQEDSQAKGAKKLKKSQKQNVKVEEALAFSSDSEDLLPVETTKMKKSKKETSRKNLMNTPNDSEDSQAKGAKKLKRSQKQNVKVEEALAFSGDSEDLLPVETTKIKKSKKETSGENLVNTPNDSEGLQAARLPTKKMKNSKKETTNEEDIEFFPNDSEDPETVNSAIETKKLKKNKKQVTCMKQAEPSSNQSEGSQAARSPTATKKTRSSKKETTNQKEIEFFPDDSEDTEAVNSAKETKTLRKNKKKISCMKQAELSNQSEGMTTRGSQVARSPTATKKAKSSKKEATNQKEPEFFPDDSEDPETVNSAIETKKFKKNQKQITSMKQAKLFSNQSEDSKPINSSCKSRRNPRNEINDRVVSYNSINESFNQTKKPNKRKRVDSGSASAEDVKENKFEFKSPVQVQKKKRLEDNVKQNLAMKKARRNKMKENRPKPK